MELFRNVNVDWLSKKWYFLGFSLVFSVAGVLSMLFWHGIPKGVDFKGGTQITVPFNTPPNEDHIRQALEQAGIKDFRTQRISNVGGQTGNDVVIALPMSTATDQAHDAGRQAVESALKANYHDSGFGQPSVDIVGPTAGKQLQKQAWSGERSYSLVGMLVYLWFRFELIYGVAAVVAVFHDTLITVGAFSLTNQEITLTVIAAILTLIGYSMNDTIVVFRPHPRKPGSQPAGVAGRRGQPVDQPDPEPDSADLGPDVSDGAEPISVWRRGAARVFVCAGGRHSDRDVLVDCGGGADAGGVPGLAQEPGQGSGAAGGAQGQGVRGARLRAGGALHYIFIAGTFFETVVSKVVALLPTKEAGHV